MVSLSGELSRQSPRRRDSFSYLSHCKQAAGRAQHTGAGQAHDDARQQHTAHAGNENILELHVQNGGCQRAGPGTGAGQRDPHKEQQGNGQTLAGLFLQLDRKSVCRERV